MRKIAVLAPALILALAACTGGAGASPSAPGPSVAAPSVAAPSPSEAASPSAMSESPSASAEPSGSAATGSAAVMVADSDLGEIVVDGEGRTLYLFTPDNHAAPTCYDSCAENWPPLMTEGDVQPGEGLEAEDFSTATRTDGGEQVRFYGWPLYYFSGDAAAGDTNGQGVGDKWYVVSPEGDAIK